MTVTCGFFNGSDRAANATDVCSIFDGLISDGIYDTIGTAFAVTAVGGNFLNLGPGRAWFNHTWTKNDATVVYEAPAAELLLHRWDRMVLEVDHSDAVRTNRIFIMTGTPSSTPSLPSLSAGPLKFQYSLAKIYRAAGSTSIAQIDITPEQGTVATPFVNALVEKFDIAAILTQYSDRANELIDDLEAAYLIIQQTGIPLHKNSHFIGGSDPIRPVDIGAMPYDAASTNLLINGRFDVWQRGTSFSANGYTADRWNLQFNGTGAARAITRQAFTVGQTAVPENPQYYLRYNQSVAGSGGTYNILQQRVENVLLLSGKTVTLSFYAKAAAATSVYTYANQNFGSGGSSDVGVMGATISVGTSWVKYTQTFDIPSVTGKTVVANNYTYFGFSLPNNATFIVDLANVQLNYGSVALPFVPRSFADELRACQWYYRPLVINTLAAIYFTGYARLASASFSVMRVAPTATVGTVSFIGNDGTPGTLFDAGVSNGVIAPIYNWTGGTVGKTFMASISLSLDAEL